MLINGKKSVKYCGIFSRSSVYCQFIDGALYCKSLNYQEFVVQHVNVEGGGQALVTGKLRGGSENNGV